MALWDAKPLDEHDTFLGPKATPVSEWTQRGKPNNMVVELPKNVVMVPTPSSTAGYAGEKARLFIRPNTMAVMKDVFDDMDGEKSRTRFMRILGTPGVGKSRSIDYALWLGIHQRRLVFVCNVKRGVVCAVVPSADESDPPIVLQIDMMHWNARVVPALLGTASLEYLPKHRPLYLYDPNKEDVVSVLAVYGNMIVFVSPNDKNVPSAVDTEEAHVFMDPWLVEQLVAVRPYIEDGDDLTDQDVRDRYAKCGGAPRYIFMNESEYKGHLLTLQKAIEWLTHKTIHDLYNSIPEFEHGVFITVKLGHKISYKLLRVVATPGNRRNAEIVFLSPWVLVRIYKHVIPTWTKDLNAVEFEKLSMLYISVFASVSTKWELFKQVFLDEPAKEIGNWTPSGGGEPDGAPVKVVAKFLDELQRLPRDRARVFLIPRVSNQAIVDGADRPWRFYQMTTAIKHPNAPAYLPELLAAAGRNSAGRIEIIYVVQETNYDSFGWQIVKDTSVKVHKAAAKNAKAAAKKAASAGRVGRTSKRRKKPTRADKIAGAVKCINAASEKRYAGSANITPDDSADDEKGESDFTVGWTPVEKTALAVELMNSCVDQYVLGVPNNLAGHFHMLFPEHDRAPPKKVEVSKLADDDDDDDEEDTVG